jgi:predicted proteasome-type protease
MTPKEEAKELVNKFSSGHPIICKMNTRNMYISEAKQCALIAVDYIITSNPHSNPFNTDVYSTMSYWQQVKTEIEKL